MSSAPLEVIDTVVPSAIYPATGLKIAIACDPALVVIPVPVLEVEALVVEVVFVLFINV